MFLSFLSILSKILLFNSCKPVRDLLICVVFTSVCHKCIERFYWPVNYKTHFDWLQIILGFPFSIFSTKYATLELWHPDVLYLEQISCHNFSAIYFEAFSINQMHDVLQLCNNTKYQFCILGLKFQSSCSIVDCLESTPGPVLVLLNILVLVPTRYDFVFCYEF